ncbi:MFS transporter [Brevibacillus choshinensis]|uniref:MFS transporter n=1 Tax=Brevibacillus choshinensis TaxID=54911 RepID=A0ABX7FSS8_BRECH|nr:MFS transporter [Brevibacillus choshinensis]QRG69301.1 MFS transporter [Brevibacillus choshinensis]
MNCTILYLLTIGVFLTATSELIVGGILPIIADDLQLSVALAGQLITAFSLAYAIGTPIVVTLTSRMERKKLLIGSLLAFIFGCLFALWCSQFLVLIGSRILTGVSAGVFLVVSFSTVSRLVAPDKIGSAIGTLILGFSTAIVLGIPLGITLSGWMNWKLTFLLLAIAGFFLLLGLFRFLPRMEGSPPVSFKRQLQLLTHPILLLTFLFTYFRESGISILNSYVTPYLVEILHFGVSQTSVIMFIFGLFGIAGSRIGGHATDKWGSKRIIVFSMLVLVLALTLLPLVTVTPVVAIALLALMMGGLFFLSPAVQTSLIQLSPPSAELLLSVNTSFIQLGLASGAAIGGVLIHSTSTVAYNPWGSALSLVIGASLGLVSFALNKQQQPILLQKQKSVQP